MDSKVVGEVNCWRLHGSFTELQGTFRGVAKGFSCFLVSFRESLEVQEKFMEVLGELLQVLQGRGREVPSIYS